MKKIFGNAFPLLELLISLQLRLTNCWRLGRLRRASTSIARHCFHQSQIETSTVMFDTKIGMQIPANRGLLGIGLERTTSQPCFLAMPPLSDLSKKPTKIAIIDDDESVREATGGLVRSLGYDASAFASAEEFLKSEQVHDTSCVISDVKMPGLSGIDLQDRLTARGHRIPIIFITAHPDDSARTRAMKGGAVGFMSKPYDAEHLIGCLDKALNAS